MRNWVQTGCTVKQANSSEGEIYVQSDGYGQFQNGYIHKSHNLAEDMWCVIKRVGDNVSWSYVT